MPVQRDHVRHHRARQAIASGNDKLLKRAEKKIDYSQYKKDGKELIRAFVWGTGIALAAVVSYVIMMWVWFNVYYESFSGSIAIFLLLLGAGAFMAVLANPKVTGRDRPWLLYISALFILCAVVGLVVGFSIYFADLVYYYRYDDMRTYTNVGASQSPYSFGDGGMLLWSEDTRLDPMRSVGYKSRWDGETYCVAPIVDSTMTNANPIYYWAVGIGCCSARASFTCNDAADLSTRSALVVLEPEDIVRPWMRWAVAGSSYKKFENAIKLDEATYFTKAANEGVRLVKWSKDPVSMKDDLYSSAKSNAIIISLVYFFAVLYPIALYLGYRANTIEKKKAYLRQLAEQSPDVRLAQQRPTILM